MEVVPSGPLHLIFMVLNDTPSGNHGCFLVPGPSGARSSAPGRCTDSAAGFALWMWRWSKQNESDCKGTSASWYQIMLSQIWLLQCGFLLATVLLKLKAQHNPRQHNRSHKVYDLSWYYQYAQMESCRTMPETGNNILQCIGGPPKNPTGARCLGDNLVGSISQGLWQHRLSYLSVNLQGESWILQMMKHDETWHLQTYKSLQIPHGNHVTWWLLDSFWSTPTTAILVLALLSPCNTRLPSSCCPTWRLAWIHKGAFNIGDLCFCCLLKCIRFTLITVQQGLCCLEITSTFNIDLNFCSLIFGT